MLTNPGRRDCRGSTLLEVLVTLGILAFGLLRLAGVQSKTQQSNMESYQRAQATVLLSDMDKPSATVTAATQAMAKYGGGKYYSARNKQAIIDALKRVFDEIQAVNSSFASVALPINAANRTLNDNEVYIGMFRPDAQASLRWFGNVKRYRLVDAGSAPELGDSSGMPAVNPLLGARRRRPLAAAGDQPEEPLAVALDDLLRRQRRHAARGRYGDRPRALGVLRPGVLCAHGPDGDADERVRANAERQPADIVPAARAQRSAPAQGLFPRRLSRRLPERRQLGRVDLRDAAPRRADDLRIRCQQSRGAAVQVARRVPEPRQRHRLHGRDVTDRPDLVDAERRVHQGLLDDDAGGAGGRRLRRLLVDVNYDGFVDYAYVADLGGNLYRIDFVATTAAATPPASSQWTMRYVAYTSGAGRKFHYAPSLLPSGGKVCVALGSGDREKPLQSSYPFQSPVTNRFYVYLDDLALSPAGKGFAVNLDNALVMANFSATTSCAVAGVLPNSSARGWFMDLAAGTGAQTVTSAVIVGGLGAFSINRPIPPVEGTCSSTLGEARGYWLNLLNTSGAGEPQAPPDLLAPEHRQLSWTLQVLRSTQMSRSRCRSRAESGSASQIPPPRPAERSRDWWRRRLRPSRTSAVSRAGRWL